MEKIDILVWSDAALPAAGDLDKFGQATVSRAARLPNATLLIGRGADLAGLVELWIDSVDVWPDVVALVPGDAYLVTESVPQPRTGTPELTHCSWFPKPERLTEAEFFHGWQVLHTPSSAWLHPRRQGYVRDAVARTLTAGSPPVRAIVTEFFDEDDYLDPARLFGDDEAMRHMAAELPLYADAADISCAPLRRD